MSRYVANPMLGEELKRSTMFVDDMLRVAQDIAEGVEACAPVADGDYKDSIEAEAGMDSDGAQGRVNVNDWKAVFIEYGTTEHPFLAPVRRGVESKGHKLTDEAQR